MLIPGAWSSDSIHWPRTARERAQRRRRACTSACVRSCWRTEWWAGCVAWPTPWKKLPWSLTGPFFLQSVDLSSQGCGCRSCGPNCSELDYRSTPSPHWSAPWSSRSKLLRKSLFWMFSSSSSEQLAMGFISMRSARWQSWVNSNFFHRHIYILALWCSVDGLCGQESYFVGSNGDITSSCTVRQEGREDTWSIIRPFHHQGFGSSHLILGFFRVPQPLIPVAVLEEISPLLSSPPFTLIGARLIRVYSLIRRWIRVYPSFPILDSGLIGSECGQRYAQ